MINKIIGLVLMAPMIFYLVLFVRVLFFDKSLPDFINKPAALSAIIIGGTFDLGLYFLFK